MAILGEMIDSPRRVMPPISAIENRMPKAVPANF